VNPEQIPALLPGGGMPRERVADPAGLREDHSSGPSPSRPLGATAPQSYGDKAKHGRGLATHGPRLRSPAEAAPE
jgi:hypothetical protein